MIAWEDVHYAAMVDLPTPPLPDEINITFFRFSNEQISGWLEVSTINHQALIAPRRFKFQSSLSTYYVQYIMCNVCFFISPNYFHFKKN